MAEVGGFGGGRHVLVFDPYLEHLEPYNGEMPHDADPWCKDLHRLVSKIYGEDRPGGDDPHWWAPDNDDVFLAWEAIRRKVPKDPLWLLSSVAYSDASMTMVKYVTGRNASVNGLLFGNGEKLGEWEAYTLLYAKPEWRLNSLVAGQKVTVGTGPSAQRAIVARILIGSKPAGRADEEKTQRCYYVLLQVGDELEYSFEYVALQHIHYTPCYGGFMDMDDGWCDELPSCGTMEWTTSMRGTSMRLQPKLLHFKPKSVSAVAKLAAQYASKVSGKKRKAEPEAAASSDSASDDDESESD